MPCGACGRRGGAEGQLCVGCRTLARLNLLWKEVGEADEGGAVSALRECAGQLSDFVEARRSQGHSERRRSSRRRRSREEGHSRDRRRRSSGVEETPKPPVEDKKVPIEEKEKAEDPKIDKGELSEEVEEGEESECEEDEPDKPAGEAPSERKTITSVLYLKACGKASAAKPKTIKEIREEQEKAKAEKEKGADYGGSSSVRDDRERKERTSPRREVEREKKEGGNPRGGERGDERRPRPRSPPYPPRHHGGGTRDRSRSKKRQNKGKQKRERGKEWRRQRGWAEKGWHRK